MSTAADNATLTPPPLTQIATGFWAFKTLAAATDLDLFTRLAGGLEIEAGKLAQELGIADRPAEMLLTGCASLGLPERGRYGYRITPSHRQIRRACPAGPHTFLSPAPDIHPGPPATSWRTHEEHDHTARADLRGSRNG